MTTPTPDRTPAGDLRERLANTLHCPTCGVEPGGHCLRARDENRQPHMTRVQAADAVLPVVEAETAALRERVEEAEAYAAYLDRDVIKPERALHEQTIKRAEEAERQRAEALAAVQRVRDLHSRPRTDRHGSGCIQCGIVWPCPTLSALDQPEETSDG